MRKVVSNLVTLAVVVLAGGFLAAVLVRYSPGFDSIPEDLNPDISPATLRALHERRGRENSLPVFYARYLAGAIRGDLGVSQNLKVPVTELLRERAPVTAKLILWGTAGGWLLGGLLAWMAVWPCPGPRGEVIETVAFFRQRVAPGDPSGCAGARLFLLSGATRVGAQPGLLPRLFGTMRALLDDCYASPALLAARSRGVGPIAIATRYVLLTALLQLIALFGVAGAGFRIGYFIEALGGVPAPALWRWRRPLPATCRCCVVWPSSSPSSSRWFMRWATGRENGST